MNGQPPEIIGILGAIFMALFFFAMIIKGMFGKPKSIFSKDLDPNSWDMIPIATFTETKITQPKPKQKRKVQPKKTVEPKINQELFNNCVQALVALGFKSKDAKTDAKRIFANNQISSEQQFLKIAFKK